MQFPYRYFSGKKTHTGIKDFEKEITKMNNLIDKCKELGIHKYKYFFRIKRLSPEAEFPKGHKFSIRSDDELMNARKLLQVTYEFKGNAPIITHRPLYSFPTYKVEQRIVGKPKYCNTVCFRMFPQYGRHKCWVLFLSLSLVEFSVLYPYNMMLILRW